MPIHYKICTNCNISKQASLGFKRGVPICKDCEKISNITYNLTCVKCEEIKLNTEFRENRKICQDCERSHGRDYRRNNNKAKIWAQNNKEKMAKLQNNWYKKNKEKIREKERYLMHNDEEYNMIKNYRNSLQKLYRNERKYVNKLDIDRKYFMSWIEYCFDNKMKLGNYGSYWHIDHVIPLNKIKDVVIQKYNLSNSLFKWYNIMPVTSNHNLSKNKYFDKKQIVCHLMNLKDYLNKNDEIRKNLENNKESNMYKRLLNQILIKKFNLHLNF